MKTHEKNAVERQIHIKNTEIDLQLDYGWVECVCVCLYAYPNVIAIIIISRKEDRENDVKKTNASAIRGQGRNSD